MARTVRDTNLETRTARSRLSARKEPYWRSISQGAHIGYYKGDRGGSWIARRRGGDGRYSKRKLGTADDVQDADGVNVLDFRQAQEAARDWFKSESLKAAGINSDPAQPYTVANAIDAYLQLSEDEGKRGLPDVRYRVEAFIRRQLGNTAVADLTAARIRKWRNDLAKTPKRIRTRRGHPQRYQETSDDPEAVRKRRHSANKVLTILKSALSYAWREGKVAGNDAWRRVPPFKDVDAPRIRYLTEAECVRLVNACDSDARPLVQAALFSGCRFGELTELQCADFHPESGTLHIRRSKGGKPRTVFLSTEGARFFTRLVTGRPSEATMLLRSGGKPWHKSQQRRPLLAACKIANISPPTGVHTLRHTHASHLAMGGVPLQVIAAQLGHADTRVTERHYAHLAPSFVAASIREGLPEFGIVEVDNVTSLESHKR